MAQPDSEASPGAASQAAPEKIVIRDVSKRFRRHRTAETVEALRDVSLTIADQTFVTLIGPSGCGKTTLLRMVNGLIKPDAGEVLVSGKPPEPGPSMSFVFQSFRLIPWATVQANVAFALDVNGMSKTESRTIADHYLSVVGLSRFAKSFPNELSGGMKQRVALARALATEPDILLMDEPFASIDAQTRELMQVELMRLWTRRKSVVVFVTHSVDEAILLADKVVLMGPRPGRIVEVLDVNLPRPRWDYNARARKDFIELRTYLFDQMRAMVMDDPNSDFFARH